MQIDYREKLEGGLMTQLAHVYIVYPSGAWFMFLAEVD
jgi:hypothetical protein